MLDLKNINYTVKTAQGDERPIFNQLSLSLAPHKLYGLLGVNGVGKTTFLNLISGLVAPTTGTVAFKKEDIYQSAKQRRNYLDHVGYCLQNPDSLFFNKTVLDELRYGAGAAPVDDLIQQFALKPLLTASPFELSGGQKKRLALAIMLKKQPEILLCDEITAGLDAHYRQFVLDLLQQYKRQHLTIWVTHDIDEAVAVSDELLFIGHGRVQQYPILAALRQPAIFKHYHLAIPSQAAISKALIAQGLFTDQQYYRSNQEIAAAIAQIWKLR